MCGIAGAINFHLPFDSIREKMLHRGPDEQNKFEDGNVSFYHLRLSILDISGGCQPMHLADRYTIIFNGQIYNHAELRKQHGLEGKSYSDTETLLLLYERFGENMLNMLDGMFVFSIYDRQNNTVFLARDRAGKKPLYIFNDGNKIVFASELNALKAILPLELDEKNFSHYFRLGVFYRHLTPYRHVKEMEAGTWIRFDCSSREFVTQRWWNIHDFYTTLISDDLSSALKKTDTLLHESIKRRLASSDLEVGCFLSGGIDSGLVT
ncbi:MAG: asparagine synthetase B, partial [Chitinophagaceae bacterium]